MAGGPPHCCARACFAKYDPYAEESSLPRLLLQHHTRILIVAALLLAAIFSPGSVQEVFAEDGGGQITAPDRWLYMYPASGNAKLNVITREPAAVGEGLKLNDVGTPANGRIMAWNDAGVVMYEPTDGFEGVDTFIYSLRDQHGNTATGTVTILVLGQPAVAPDKVRYEACEFVSFSGKGFGPGQPVTVSVYRNDPKTAVHSFQVTADTDGRISGTFQARLEWVKVDGGTRWKEFLLGASDGTATVENWTNIFGIMTEPKDGFPGCTPPTAHDHAVEVTVGGSVLIDVLATARDAEGNGPEAGNLALQAIGTAAYGSVTTTGDGLVDYVARADLDLSGGSLSDVVTYTIVDVRNNQQASANIHVKIVPVAVEAPSPALDRNPPPPPVQHDAPADTTTDIEPEEPAVGDDDGELDSPPPAANHDPEPEGDLPFTGGHFLWQLVAGSALVAIGGWQALKPRRWQK